MTIEEEARAKCKKSQCDFPKCWIARNPSNWKDFCSDTCGIAIIYNEAFAPHKHETQESVCAWASSTFGPTTLWASISRYLLEAKELETLCVPRNGVIWRDKLPEEIADCVITLYRVCEELGVSLAEEVDKKMAINRSREWKLNGDGTGQHL